GRRGAGGGGGDEWAAPGRHADRRDPGLLRRRRGLPAAQAQPRALAGGGPDPRDRPGRQLHGRGPLARRRGRPPRRLPDRLPRPGLRRAPPRAAVRPHRHGPSGPRRLDPLPSPGRTRKRKRRKTRMTRLSDLGVKIFADGADRGGMLDLYRNPLIKGFTTNPTLMRHAGIADYEAFARDILR